MVSPTFPSSSSDSTSKNANAAREAARKPAPTSVTQPAVPFAKMLARLAAPPPPVQMHNVLPPATPAAKAGAEVARERHERNEASERAQTEQANDETSQRTSRHRDLKDEGDALSSWSRHCADLAPPQMQAALVTAAATKNEGTPAARAHASLEELLPGMVKRVAWSGDGKRGAVRMELGAGELAGSTLLVEADGPSVRVTLDAPSGVSTAAWQQTIRARLEARGLDVESVEVR